MVEGWSCNKRIRPLEYGRTNDDGPLDQQW